jgi:hypothetical protein
MIARIYANLGMTLAAKQYRLTAAYLAMASLDHSPGGLAASGVQPW